MGGEVVRVEGYIRCLRYVGYRSYMGYTRRGAEREQKSRKQKVESGRGGNREGGKTGRGMGKRETPKDEG